MKLTGLTRTPKRLQVGQLTSPKSGQVGIQKEALSKSDASSSPKQGGVRFSEAAQAHLETSSEKKTTTPQKLKGLLKGAALTMVGVAGAAIGAVGGALHSGATSTVAAVAPEYAKETFSKGGSPVADFGKTLFNISPAMTIRNAVESSTNSKVAGASGSLLLGVPLGIVSGAFHGAVIGGATSVVTADNLMEGRKP